MRKFILMSWILVMLSFSFVYATNTASLFQYDKASVESEFSELNQLEQYVHNHESGSIRNMEHLSKVMGVMQDDEEAASSDNGFAMDDMDWGAFAWGFCCCPIGFFTVAINSNKTNDQKLSYWIGVGVSTVLSAISTAASYSYYDFSYY